MKHWMAGAMLCCSAVAHAGSFYNGNDLLSKMEGSTINRTAAAAYVVGVADANDGVTVCLPPGVTVGQIFEIVQHYLQNHPEARHYTASSITRNVLSGTYPCAQKQQSYRDRSAM